MEKYSNICRFIMWSNSLSKVIEPLRSRCFCFKLTVPTDSELFSILVNICGKELISLSLAEYDEIIQRSGGNVKKLLWLLEIKKHGDSMESIYDIKINEIIQCVFLNKIETLLSIRELAYHMMITNIDGTMIMKDILDKLLAYEKLSMIQKTNIVEACAAYEHNLIRGRREIIHLEVFMINVMKIIHKY